MRHASLFSGIGGFDLAAQWMGWENVLQCEIDPFCQKVLKYHFPQAKLYDDIRSIDGTEWRGAIDIISGGFPCQPFSAAGKRRGTEDDRHLWPEMLRVIQEIKPTWVIGENVRGIASWNEGMVFEQVCAEMEANEYEVQPFCIPAAGVNAPHKRERIWFVAHSKSTRARCKSGEATDEEWGASEDRGEGIRQAHRETGSSGADPTARDAPNPNNTGSGTSRSRTDEDRQEEDEGRERQPQSRISRYNKKLSATHSESQRDRRSTSEERRVQERELEQDKQEGGEVWGEGEGCTCESDVADTDSGRVRRHEREGAEEGAVTRSSTSHNGSNSISKGLEGCERGCKEGFRGGCERCPEWSEPWLEAATRLCRVDDGVPGELDGITVPKWRRESLKAYGNAIVPQIAYQIFQSIPIS